MREVGYIHHNPVSVRSRFYLIARTGNADGLSVFCPGIPFKYVFVADAAFHLVERALDRLERKIGLFFHLEKRPESVAHSLRIGLMGES
jgi:hypothetical protein